MPNCFFQNMLQGFIRWIAFCCFLFCSLTGTAQISPDSSTLEISLLTCSPGTDLYSLFGHTAIRVRDQRRGMDIVYNYGTFDDSDKLFYFHFTRGIMLYSLSAEPFDSFMVEYQYEHRGVTEQTINLSSEQKKALFEALRQNTAEDKRYYNYQFYNDNCTTRAGKIILANSQSPVLKNILPQPSPSYRQMIHFYLERQQQYWAEFGIDLFLGANLDEKPTNEQAMYFLPDYLMNGFDHAEVSGGNLVIRKQSLLQFPETNTENAWLTPFSLFSFLLLLILGLSRIKKPSVQKALDVFDVILFVVVGLLGCIMLYLWIARIDEGCRNNLNILWAVPTHIIAVLFLRRKPVWLTYYFLFSSLLSVILLLGFAWWPQRMNRAMIPLLMILALRSIYQYVKSSHAKDHPPRRKAASV